MKSLSTALRFLYGLGDGPGSSSLSPRWLHLVTPLGLAVGLAMVLVTANAWRYLHALELWTAMLPVLVLWWLGPGVAWMLGLGRLALRLRVGQSDQRLGEGGAALLSAAAVICLLIAWYALMVSLPRDSLVTSGRLPTWLAQIVHPRKLWAAITMASVWGHGGVLLGAMLRGQRVEPGAGDGQAVDQLLDARGWVKMLWGWIAPAALTIWFFLPWWSGGWASALALSVIIGGLLMLYGWLLARRAIPQTRATLLAGGVLAQLTFLVGFHVLI